MPLLLPEVLPLNLLFQVSLGAEAGSIERTKAQGWQKGHYKRKARSRLGFVGLFESMKPSLSLQELWVEKYRPSSVKEYVFKDEAQRKQVQNYRELLWM